MRLGCRPLYSYRNCLSSETFDVSGEQLPLLHSISTASESATWARVFSCEEGSNKDIAANRTRDSGTFSAIATRFGPVHFEKDDFHDA